MNGKHRKPNSFQEPPPWEAEIEKKQLELFADVASHDLQEPLEKIIFFGDFIKQRYGAGMDDRGKDYLERLIGSAMRMSRLIEDILDFSRLTSRTSELKPVDLTNILREVLSDLEVRIRESKALVEVGKLPFINADSKQIYHLFLNLISNAIKFRKKEEPPHIIVRALEEKEIGHVSIVVEDNGIGFDQQYADQIFKPFERLHSQSDYEGSGLGLSICQRIVVAHGGHISAKGVPGKGAMFIMTLPKIEKEAGCGEKSSDR